MNPPSSAKNKESQYAWRSVRRATLRGLGVVLPSLLTVIFLLWLWNAVNTYVLAPLGSLSREIVVSNIEDVHHRIPSHVPTDQVRRNAAGRPISFDMGNTTYVPLTSGEWVPRTVYDEVQRNPGPVFPTTAEAVYNRYVERIYFRHPGVVVAISFAAFLFLVYLLGSIIAARIGSVVFGYFEQLIHRLPFISTVYGTVKQVTDILFAETELQYSRVVAVQYPREGVWSLGFVTGESLPMLSGVVQEPMLSVLMPTSPMPATGFTINIRKRDAIDLNITVDQAFQFIVSCGVVVPGRSKTGIPVSPSSFPGMTPVPLTPDGLTPPSPPGSESAS